MFVERERERGREREREREREGGREGGREEEIRREGSLVRFFACVSGTDLLRQLYMLPH